MIKKIIFAGCSITAGNELWEEAHVPNYASMTFKESRKMMDSFTNFKEVEEPIIREVKLINQEQNSKILENESNNLNAPVIIFKNYYFILIF